MPIITCPNCKSILQPIDKSVRCPNGHSFDFSKGGYVNLLLANHKKKANPGDNKLMVNAREAFLSEGHYDFLIQNIRSTSQSIDIFSSDDDTSVHLLDLGCGSGYYTRNIFKQQEDVIKIGVDISKVAIAKAAVKDKESTYIVGSVFKVPIADNSTDVVLNIFSPIDLEELGRLLKPEGYFIKVIPTGDHMREVAELVYDDFIPHQSTIKEDIESNSRLEVVKVENLKREISLFGSELHNFISMTPYLYKFNEGQLESLEELNVTISFEIIICKNIEPISTN